MSMYGDYKGKRLVARVIANVFGPSLAKQAFAEECDINEILRRSALSGVLGHVNDRAALYEDVSEVPDFHDAMNIVVDAKERFASLDAPVRERFQNDPGVLMEFLSDESNRAEAEKLRLISPRPAQPAAVVPPVGEKGGISPDPAK